MAHHPREELRLLLREGSDLLLARPASFAMNPYLKVCPSTLQVAECLLSMLGPKSRTCVALLR